jgi:endogenous inhibitor of DNA gyrase (YacG/DUF329 family)
MADLGHWIAGDYRIPVAGSELGTEDDVPDPDRTDS